MKGSLMSKNSFNASVAAQQSRVLEASKAMGAVAASKAEEIAKINQQAAQKMEHFFRKKLLNFLRHRIPSPLLT